jgi:hypothetical protein
MKPLSILFLAMTFLLFSCKKDKVPQIDPNACQDEMFNNKDLRMNGVWELQSNSNVPGPFKIEFLNDTIIKMMPHNADTVWRDIKYRMRCKEFEYDKYWIIDPGPFQNWWVCNSSYNPETKIWLLTQYDFVGGGGYDSAFFLKK